MEASPSRFNLDLSVLEVILTLGINRTPAAGYLVGGITDHDLDYL